MHPFDNWLLERLAAFGALRHGDAEPDVPAALRFYQENKGIAVTGEADGMTIWLLRCDQCSRPEVEHIHFLPVPTATGSLYGQVKAA